MRVLTSLTRVRGRGAGIGTLLIMLALSAMLPLVVAAQTAGAGTASGTGTLHNGTQTFSFSATGDPSAATGTMHWEFHDATRDEVIDAEVTCMNVRHVPADSSGPAGNGAFILGTVTASTYPGLDPGDHITFDAIDVATPGVGSDRFVINIYPDTVQSPSHAVRSSRALVGSSNQGTSWSSRPRSPRP